MKNTKFIFMIMLLMFGLTLPLAQANEGNLGEQDGGRSPDAATLCNDERNAGAKVQGSGSEREEGQSATGN